MRRTVALALLTTSCLSLAACDPVVATSVVASGFRVDAIEMQ